MHKQIKKLMPYILAWILITAISAVIYAIGFMSFNRACGLSLASFTLLVERKTMAEIRTWGIQFLLSINKNLSAKYLRYINVKNIDPENKDQKILDSMVFVTTDTGLWIIAVIKAFFFVVFDSISGNFVKIGYNYAVLIILEIFKKHCPILAFIMLLLFFATRGLVCYYVSQIVQQGNFIRNFIVLTVFLVLKKIINMLYFGGMFSWYPHGWMLLYDIFWMAGIFVTALCARRAKVFINSVSKQETETTTT